MGQSLLNRCPIVPVVVIADAAQAIPLGEALLAGGINVIEVTLRTPAGIAAVRILAAALPDLQVGAGSVLNPGQVDEVVDAGAQFIVSPGLSLPVLERARAHNTPALPGIATATELMSAGSLGLTEVKFFPAGFLGGPAAIRALSAPIPHISFLPSGGVNADNIGDYLSLPCVPAVSGSWMVEPALLQQERWGEVTARAAAAIGIASSHIPVPPSAE